jgi:hypothetical protein
MKTFKEWLFESGYDIGLESCFMIKEEAFGQMEEIDLFKLAEQYAELYHVEKVAEVTNEIIQKHIELNTRDDEGFSMMHEETFYQGALWMRNRLTGKP